MSGNRQLTYMNSSFYLGGLLLTLRLLGLPSAAEAGGGLVDKGLRRSRCDTDTIAWTHKHTHPPDTPLLQTRILLTLTCTRTRTLIHTQE